MEVFFRTISELFNETLASTIVVLSASLLLYNLSRNMHDRVARASGAMLACVTVAYTSDVLLGLEPGPGTSESLLRLQWVGLSIIPAAMFHLSDALLATTGLPSRGRRRRVVRMLYVVAMVFILLAAFTDWLVSAEVADVVGGRVSLRARPVFAIYLLYFVLANGIAFLNVNRARMRCLTRSTARRMAYLQSAMLTPSIGIFPYSVLLAAGEEFSLAALVLVNVANLLVVMMLAFLAYPLSFFGSQIPDRVVKADLLRFMLRGPGTGLLALVVIIFTTPTSEAVGVAGADFMPFAVVATILLWQWGLDPSLPWLERRLIYDADDAEQLSRIETLSERLLTRTDLLQLLEATLEATCDYLRLSKAFIATLTDDKPEMVRAIGDVSITNQVLQAETLPLLDDLYNGGRGEVHRWGEYWAIPLYSLRNTDASSQPSLIGMMGIEAINSDFVFNEDEHEMLHVFIHRAGQTLDDMLLQTEIYAALAGLLPQITITRSRASEVEYRPGRSTKPQISEVLDRNQVIEQVHAALRHYWGGPGMSRSRLLELVVVRERLDDNEHNPVRALRSVLQEAIDNQRPEGARDMHSPEWTLYNILTLRFIDKRKAKETARQLYISEANLYRKQSSAIEAVADAIIKLEREALATQKRLVME